MNEYINENVLYYIILIILYDPAYTEKNYSLNLQFFLR